jgi:hypothetical protein
MNAAKAVEQAIRGEAARGGDEYGARAITLLDSKEEEPMRDRWVRATVRTFADRSSQFRSARPGAGEELGAWSLVEAMPASLPGAGRDLPGGPVG